MTNAQRRALEEQERLKNELRGKMNSSEAAYNSAMNEYKQALNTDYQPSQQALDYQNQSNKALDAAKAMGNFKYTSNYTGDIKGLMDDIKNKQFNFKYSLTDDPAYLSMRDQAVHQGQMAAQDAMGNMVGATGGFGSTAAQAASQQAYNESLTRLNDKVPELYNMAYNRQRGEFESDRNNLKDLLHAVQSQDAQEFSQQYTTWKNNFDQFMDIANQYEQKYEYMDSAERRKYEAKLDGLYNSLAMAQNQYGAALGGYGNASNGYTDALINISGQEEAARHNQAMEAAARAKASGSGSSKSKSGKTPKYTANQLINSYSRGTSARGNYADYNGHKVSTVYKDGKLLKDLTTKYNSGDLSADDYARLVEYYGLA